MYAILIFSILHFLCSVIKFKRGPLCIDSLAIEFHGLGLHSVVTDMYGVRRLGAGCSCSVSPRLHTSVGFGVRAQVLASIGGKPTVGLTDRPK